MVLNNWFIKIYLNHIYHIWVSFVNSPCGLFVCQFSQLTGFVVSSDLHRKRLKNVHLACEFASVSWFFWVKWSDLMWHHPKNCSSSGVSLKIVFFKEISGWIMLDKYCNSPMYLLYISFCAWVANLGPRFNPKFAHMRMEDVKECQPPPSI